MLLRGMGRNTVHERGLGHRAAPGMCEDGPRQRPAALPRPPFHFGTYAGMGCGNVHERCPGHRARPGNVKGLADATLMNAASAFPHTLPVTKAAPNPTDSREEAAATAMGQPHSKGGIAFVRWPRVKAAGFRQATFATIERVKPRRRHNENAKQSEPM